MGTPFRPGSVPSLPEYFPGANERVSGIEVERAAEGVDLEDDRTEPSFLTSGTITIRLPPDDHPSPEPAS